MIGESDELLRVLGDEDFGKWKM